MTLKRSPDLPPLYRGSVLFKKKTCGTLVGQDSWARCLNTDTSPEPPHCHRPEHLGNVWQAGSLHETEWLGDPVIISEKTASRKESSLCIAALH